MSGWSNSFEGKLGSGVISGKEKGGGGDGSSGVRRGRVGSSGGRDGGGGGRVGGTDGGTVTCLSASGSVVGLRCSVVKACHCVLTSRCCSVVDADLAEEGRCCWEIVSFGSLETMTSVVLMGWYSAVEPCS